MNEERDYIAFISYRHLPLDQEAAVRIQKKIENYTVPREFREQFGGKKLGKVFRDEDELPVSASLTDSIYYALDHTEYLIVICTPALPLSKWCEAEIRYFLRTHDRDHIIAVLADGTSAESFSPYLLHTFDADGNITGDTEPLAANIAGADHKINHRAFKKEIVRIFAALIGCPFDALWQRDRRARTNRLMTAGAAVIAVLAVFLGIVLNRNAKIEEANRQITAQNDQIQEQNTELQRQLSTALVDSGFGKLESYDRKSALADALEASESGDPDIIDHRVESLLSEALGAYVPGNAMTEAVYTQSTNITDLALSDDQQYVFILDAAGTLRCLDAEMFQVRWEYPSGDAAAEILTKNLAGRVILKALTEAVCLDLQDGSVCWRYSYGGKFSSNRFCAFSEDGKLLALLDNSDNETKSFNAFISFLDTQSGEELGRITFANGRQKIHCDGEKRDYAYSFSDGNQRLLCNLKVTDTTDDNKEFDMVLSVDLTTFQEKALFTLNNVSSLYGLTYCGEEGAVFAACRRGGAILTVMATPGEDGYEFQSASFSYTTSYDSYYADERKMIRRGDYAYLLGEEQLFVLDLPGYTGSYKVFSEDPVNLVLPEGPGEWVQFITSDGTVRNYKKADSSTDFDYMASYRTGIDHLILSRNINGGLFLCSEDTASLNKEGALLSVSSDDPYSLLKTAYHSDPSGELLYDFTGTSEDSGLAAVNQELFENEYKKVRNTFKRTRIPDLISDGVPGTDLLFIGFRDFVSLNKETGEPDILLNSEYGLTDYYADLFRQTMEAGNYDFIVQGHYHFFLIDKKTGGIVHEIEFENTEPIIDIVLTDEDHFLSGTTLYGFDGSSEKYGTLFSSSKYEDYIRSNDFSERLSASSYADHSEVMTGGGILSMAIVLDDKEGAHFGMIPVWINGELVLDPYETSPEESLAFWLTDEKEIHVSSGSNGLIMAYGCRTDLDPESKEENFFIYDPSAGSIVSCGNPDPSCSELQMSMGNEKPMAAAAFNDGNVFLLNTESRIFSSLDKTYAAGDIVSVDFSEGDNYLLIFCTSGLLDIYRTDTLQLVYSETFEGEIDLAEITERDALRAALSEDGTRLVVSFGTNAGTKPGQIIDTESWTKITDVANLYCMDSSDHLYVWNNQWGEYFICSYPLHSLEDLRAWAAQELEE